MSLPHPSTVTLHAIITKHLPLPHNPSQNHCVYPASPLHLPCVLSCVLRLCLITPASHITLHSPVSPCILPCHPAFSHVTLRSPASPCVCILHLLQSHCPQNIPWTGTSLFPSLRLSSLVFQSSTPHSVIQSIPPFSLPFRVFSSKATSSWDFLSPHPIFFPPFLRASVSDPPSFHHHRCCLLQYLQLFLEFSPFCCLEGSHLLFRSHFCLIIDSTDL